MSLLKMGGVCMMQQFLSALGYQFKNPALLGRALTHPSMGPEDNHSAWNFWGTRCCNTSCRISSYQSHPDCHEGQLTHLRALSVCEANLSQVAKKLHVGEALIMDKGEDELTGGREKPSVLCDAMEAILAAVYLDGGLDAARAIILRCWPKPEDVQRPDGEPGQAFCRSFCSATAARRRPTRLSRRTVRRTTVHSRPP